MLKDSMSNSELNEEELKWLFKVLAKIDFFKEVSITDIEKITKKFFKETAAANKVMIEQGTKSEAIYIIKTGSCNVYRKKGIFGKTETIAVLKEGDFFGEMSMMLNFPAFCSVKTVEPTEFFTYLKSDFLSLLSSNAALFEKVKHIAEIRRYEDFKK
jgi:CRP-like cAMP-binding protein